MTTPLFPAPLPPPSTKLGLHRQLAPRAGIAVSPIVLGAMSIGDRWEKHGMGTMTKESSFALLDAFVKAGGNFIDTSNNYQHGSSEEFIGEWAEARGIRDQLVIGTKYTMLAGWDNDDMIPKSASNYLGNHVKSLKLNVESSLKRLRTSYIDILYVHYWDLHTSYAEIMDSLHNLVVAGKVLYLGISDSPAWFVVKCNEYARANGKTPFVVYQGAYSILQRDLEREILPMCRHEGLALVPWNVLAGGRIRTNEEEERRKQSGEQGRTLDQTRTGWERTPEEKKVCDVLEAIAKELGVKGIAAVAIAYAIHKAAYVFPILGGRKIEHLHANIEALSIKLSDEHLKTLDDALAFDIGFPNNMAGSYDTQRSYSYPHVAFANLVSQPLMRPLAGV